MREKYFLGLNPQGFHKIVYSEWGDPDNPRVVICAHGLTRNRHDFDWLAESLSKHFRVVCPDIVGRGQSDYLHDPLKYNYPQYMADMNALIARLNVEKLMWVGTSMGGLIGMMLAGVPQSPITKMVINDIGPLVPAEGLRRLSQYAPVSHIFQEFDDIIDYLKETLRGYSGFTALQWKKLAENSAVWDEIHKGWKALYDPAVAAYLSTSDLTDLDFWKYWNQLNCPCLVLHGAISDILRADTALEMSRKPRVRVIDFEGQGHALSIGTPEQIDLVAQWLLKEEQ
ncbi:MAG: alpha/beta fold hydrolase [Holosporales bacterium]